MRSLLETQLSAIEAIQFTEEQTEKIIEDICCVYGTTEYNTAFLNKALRDLVSISILYGKVITRHEMLLKDDRNIGENPQKEG